MTLSRRGLLTSAAGLAALAALGLPRRALASVPADRSFVFVFAQGGWDITRVFAPVYDNAGVDVEPDGEPATAGGIRYVDHATRPSVRQFFERHHARALVLNGLMVPSVNHETCTRLVLTGGSREGSADWGAHIGHAARGRTTLPHLVFGGPSFPGPLAESVVRTGSTGQLDALITGDVVRASALPASMPSPAAEAVVDRFLQRRAGARRLAARTDAERVLLDAWASSVDRARTLKELRYVTEFSAPEDLGLQAEVAAEVLSTGLSRSVALVDLGAGGLGWDTHTDNDTNQAANFEGLFAGLGRLMDALDNTPGRVEATLADETIVVVVSEMGRTPKLNGARGKDHWPTTSALLLGPGLTTDRVVGGFDDGFYGRTVDTGSGELSAGGLQVEPRMLGATLLQLAGVDPADVLPDVPVLDGLLS